MHKKLIYNGKSSADMGLVIQAPPAYSVPERDVEKTHVPGRNGDVISDNGCYKNSERVYSLAKGYVYGPVKTTVANGQELYEWLTSAKGKYVRLEDDYDPEVYRLATYVSSGTLTDIFDKALTFEVKFECKPQRFLKYGLEPFYYEEGDTSVIIHNLSHYEAKPEIKIENIPSGMNAITLMSVEDENGEEVSLVTLKGDINEETTLILDSEEEECYDDEENDSYDKVSLNGKNFPVLRKGDSHIQITQYDREDFEIPSYNTVVQSKQQICESKFSPKETTIASYEDKYIVRPFNTLIKERENSFEATSYHTRLTELCDEGIRKNGKDYAISTTIDTPNSYTSGTTIEFKNVSYNDFAEEFGNYGLDFLEINADPVNPTGIGNYIVTVANGKKCYIKDEDSLRLKLYSSGEEIVKNGPGESSTKNIEILGDIQEEIKDDLPSFVDVDINVGNDKYISSIVYKFELSPYTFEDNNSVAIYYKNKVGLTGLFGKAGWSQCSDGSKIMNYTWSTYKKKFTLNGNFLAADNGYNIRFVCFNNKSSEYLQYDFGANSSKIFKVTLSDVNTIKIFGNSEGYYKVCDEEWVHIAKNGQLPDVSANASFRIEYLKEVPKYSNEIDWPNWLNSSPLFYNSSEREVRTDTEKLNADHIKFKVNLKTYYRYYYKINDIETNTDFYELNEGDFVEDESGSYLKVELSDSATIGKYFSENWESPYDVPEFPSDRANSIGNQTPTLEPYLPDWLRYEVEMKIKFNSDPSNEYTSSPIGGVWYDEDKGYFLLTFSTQPKQGDSVFQIGDYDNPIGECVNYDMQTGKIYVIYYGEGETVHEVPKKEDEYAWKVNSQAEQIDNNIFFTHDKWYTNINDKIFDANGNEIGYSVESPNVLFYSGNSKGGFYKYDNTTAWVYYEANETENPIVKIGFKDSINFYYVENLPENYDEYYSEDPPAWLEYFEIIRKPNGNVNPLSIDFKIKNNSGGYYKSNSQVHWNKYNVGDTVLTTLVSETNKISHLKEKERSEDGKQPSLSRVKIVVTPKWWML